MLAWPRVTYSRHGRVIRARHWLSTEDLNRIASGYFSDLKCEYHSHTETGDYDWLIR